MKHIGLFEGIGGFSLAARWMGWQTIAWCEINPFGQQVLKYYFPNATGHHDIKQTDFTIYRGKCDILTGGFPCQPYSAAGKRLGTEDDRHLWPEMLRAIREIQPTWIVGENVRGLTNWNGGLVFDQVQADLEAEGYEVTPFLLPACAVNAPHRRDRIWFIAYSKNNGYGRKYQQREEIGISERGLHQCSKKRWDEVRTKFERYCESRISADTTSEGRKEWEHERSGKVNSGFERPGCLGDVTNTCDKGLQGGENNRSVGGIRKIGNQQLTRSLSPAWQNFPTQSPVCSRNDGVSSRLDAATLLKGRTPRQPWRAFGKWRQESIKAYGNAVVPQLVLQIFKAIEKYRKAYF